MNFDFLQIFVEFTLNYLFLRCHVLNLMLQQKQNSFSTHCIFPTLELLKEKLPPMTFVSFHLAFQLYILHQRLIYLVNNVANIETLEHFWAYYQHLKRPTSLPVGCYIYLFKEGVKPVWQDPANRNGCAFVLRFEKSKSNGLWQDILLAVVSAKAEVFRSLNGVRLKVKKDFLQIEFWVSKVQDEQSMQFYRKWIMEITSLTNDTPIEVIHFKNEE